ncbi:MAG: T9SS C-terminal target domain-containing protein, partial [Prevotella sp.]|nr:T9SS C-terminal target domain-containing protein [Prevotella sp.]
MKRIVLLILWFSISTTILSQTVYKIDINEYSRTNMDEVLEPGFTPWRFEKDTYQSTLTMDDGVVFTIRSEYNLRSGWNKAFVQKKDYNSRLTGDGANLDPNACGSFDLIIKGLSPGQHTIQTYHNGWNDPENTAGWPITVSLNGVVAHQSVARTEQVSVAQDAAILITQFSVNTVDEEIILTFATNEDDAPSDAETKKTLDKTPLLNGFMIDAITSSEQAKRPNPEAGNMHIDADEGTYQISWSAANNQVVKHHFYFGTDSVTVAEATTATYEGTDTTWLATNLKNKYTYYWRVDEESTDGVITRGEIWKFRPRHLAFKGAEGYGRFANGGRGGKVVYVTNLNDSGEGSFREAATSGDGPRTILFDVSGIIPLESRLVIDKDVTIAGQSAPGKGICFRKSPLGMNHDAICRFIRMRLGHGPTADGIGMAGVCEGIVDHCSISWTIDEAFSSRNAYNITLQHTLISEALSIADHKNYP